MIETKGKDIPADHPIRQVFETLTTRGMDRIGLRDNETNLYISNLLLDFSSADSMYRTVSEESLEFHRYQGDFLLFNLGLFPGSLTSGRHTVSLSFYVERGRQSYRVVADFEASRTRRVYQKLSERFQQYVHGLNLVKLYINDPFYQYMFRQFGVT